MIGIERRRSAWRGRSLLTCRGPCSGSGPARRGRSARSSGGAGGLGGRRRWARARLGGADGLGQAAPRPAADRRPPRRGIPRRHGRFVPLGESDADAGVFWHAGSVLALPETGLPSQYSPPARTAGVRGRAVGAHRVARPPGGADGCRVLFAVDDGGPTDHRPRPGEELDGIWLRVGEWDAPAALRARTGRRPRARDVAARRGSHIEARGVYRVADDAPGGPLRMSRSPSAGCREPSWLGVVAARRRRRDAVRWFRLDPCLVTHVLGAWEDEPRGDDRPLRLPLRRARGRAPVDLVGRSSGPKGSGSRRSAEAWACSNVGAWWAIGSSEHRSTTGTWSIHAWTPPWRVRRSVTATASRRPGRTAPRQSTALGAAAGPARRARPGRAPVGLLNSTSPATRSHRGTPGPGRRPSEPLFVRAVDGHSDDEGWLLTVVDDVNRGTSDHLRPRRLVHGPTRPEAVVHLPVRLPLRSHGEWVPADRYR